MVNKPYTIMVVDDNPELLELLQEGLSGHFRVLLARDGIEGLEGIVKAQPDCAIIDIKMPGLNGLQLLRILRGDPETMSIPLIILTAMPDEQGLMPSLLSGADRFLTKPVLPSELILAIHDVLAMSQQDRELRMRTLAEGGDM